MDYQKLKLKYLSKLPHSIRNYNPELIFLNPNTRWTKPGKIRKNPLDEILFGDITEDFTENYIKKIESYSLTNSSSILNDLENGELNVGIMLEYSDILVIDIDSELDKDGNVITNGNEIIYALDEYDFKNKTIKKHISTLANIISSNKSPRVETGTGEHHYFHFPRELYNSRKTKCLNLVKIFKDEDLQSNPFQYNGVIYSSLEHLKSIVNTIDILANLYVVAPGSEFFIDGKSVKKYKSKGLNTLELPTLDPELLFSLFKLEEKPYKKSEKKVRTLEDEIHFDDFRFLDDITIDDIQGNPEYESLIALNDDLNSRYKEYINANETGNEIIINECIRRFETLKQILVQNSNYNSNPLSLFTEQKRNKIKLMNEYVRKQRYAIHSTIHDIVESENYISNDRSKFEFGYIAKAVNLNKPVTVLIADSKNFAKNARMKDPEFILQAYEKLEHNFEINDSVIGTINRLILQARRTNFSKYFGRSQNNCKLLYMHLLKLASDYLNFKLTTESTKTLALGSTISDRSIFYTLDKLIEKSFIEVIYTYFKSKDGREFRFIESIIINKDLITEIDENIQLSHSHTSFDFEELVFMSEIGKVGATIYQSLLRNGSMSIKDIYKIFPNLKNVYCSVKPKVENLVKFRFIIYDEKTKLFSINRKDIFLNLVKAKVEKEAEKIRKKKPNTKIKPSLDMDIPLFTVEKKKEKYEKDRKFWYEKSTYLGEFKTA